MKIVPKSKTSFEVVIGEAYVPDSIEIKDEEFQGLTNGTLCFKTT